MTYTESRLWSETLAPSQAEDAHESQRTRLRAAYFAVRERAANIAALVHESHPDLTVHDITHLDALWELADCIRGAVHLNPAEGFVLGCAFLIHDLGMSLAVYPNGVAGVKSNRDWTGVVHALATAQLGRRPTAAEFLELQVTLERQAISVFLREKHAEQAHHLMVEPLIMNSGAPLYLLEDSALRIAFAEVIGKLAASHSWHVTRLKLEFGSEVLGSAPELLHPVDWTVDLLKLACLLRCADAAHLDARRAPHFLRLLVPPSEQSADYWEFQSRLRFPQRPDDQLVYTSRSPFPVSQAGAWWLCFEALQVLDAELRSSYALLSDLDRQHFAAISVKGASNPISLAEQVATVGWTPIDARVRVSAVADIVRKLGGSQLYGADLIVPLRELVQNATDAIHAFQHLEYDHPGDPQSGRVLVRVGHDASGTEWIEVEDDGIGMSAEVLSGPLLDFGHSYWGSALMRKEWAGADTTTFDPIGRYGIGFFSVFMWGDRVRVSSNRIGEARRETNVLEFPRGVSERVLLRRAAVEEQILHGTRVRVWLEKNLTLAQILESHQRNEGPNRATPNLVLSRIFSTLSVDLYLEFENSTRQQLISADDWKTMPAERLLARVWARDPESIVNEEADRLQRVAANVEDLLDGQGRQVGRISLAPDHIRHELRFNDNGVVTIGGMYAGASGVLAGVLVGDSRGVARNSPVVRASPADCARWATSQASKVHTLSADPSDLDTRSYSSVVWQMGGDLGRLPVALFRNQWLNFDEVRSTVKQFESLLLVDAYTLHSGTFRGILADELSANLLGYDATNLSLPSGLDVGGRSFREAHDLPPSLSAFGTMLFGAVVAAVAEGWSMSLHDLFQNSTIDEWPGRRVQIGRQNEDLFMDYVIELRRIGR